jgi:hypothetical protein
MALHPAEAFIHHFDGPFALVRGCKLCKHVDTVRKERSPGRGWGMREGNKQRGRLIQHVKECHPAELELEAKRQAAKRAERRAMAGADHV